MGVASGKIAGVSITSYTMQYPQAFIDPVIPQQVLWVQTWRGYIVTRLRPALIIFRSSLPCFGHSQGVAMVTMDRRRAAKKPIYHEQFVLMGTIVQIGIVGRKWVSARVFSQRFT